MRLAAAEWLWLLPLTIVPWFYALRRPRLTWPDFAGFANTSRNRPGFSRWVPVVIRSFALISLLVAMARPQIPGGTVRVAGQGIAILAVVDRSSSMKAEDFPSGDQRISRLEAARRKLAEFVRGRPDDVVGLVAFARYPDLVAAPTLDGQFLQDAIRSIRPAGAVDDGTNLGDAMAWALDALRTAPTRRKVLILVTDGRDAPAVPNPLNPLEAATIAHDLGVVIHTIAIGGASGPDGPDLPLLEKIAARGGGRPFLAKDADALAEVFREIDVLEKDPIAATVRTLYHERYAPWAGLALALLTLDAVLSASWLRSFP